MDNLIFSLNTVLPIFFLIMIGYALQRMGILSDEFRAKTSKLVFYVALPANLFRSVANSDLMSGLNLKFVLFAWASTLVVFFGAWLLTVLVIKDRSQRSAVVHGSFRGNFAYVGLAVAQNLLQTDVLIACVMVIAFVVPLYNVLAIIVLSYYDPKGGKVSVKKIVTDILKNPLIIGILIAIPFSLLQIPIPYMFDKTLSYLAQLATPLALLLIGANLRPETFRKKPKGILLSSTIKIVLAPLFGTLAAYALGFRGEELITIFIMHGVPSAANSYIMTVQMGGDAEIGAGIVMATSLASTLTMAVAVFLFRSLGLV